jgi:hypothetical protein
MIAVWVEKKLPKKAPGAKWEKMRSEQEFYGTRSDHEEKR